MKNNIFNFKEPIFETNLFLVFVNSKKQAKKAIKELKKSKAVTRNAYEFPNIDDYYGMVASIDNVSIMVINLKTIAKGGVNIFDILMHETRHVESDILAYKGVVGLEAVAYYNEAVFRFARLSYQEYLKNNK